MISLALCTPAYLPAVEFGGPVWVVKHIGDELCRRHDAVVWAPDFGVSRRAREGAREQYPRVRYFRRMFAYRWSPVVPQVYFAARRAKVDIAHIFGLRDGFTIPAALGFRHARVPYIVEPLGMLVPRVRSIGLKRAFDSALGTRHLRAAAGLVATSRLEEQEIRAAFPDARAWVRPNPIVVEADVTPDAGLRARLNVGDDELLVGYLGRVSVKKGLDVLAEALALTPEVHAVVIGPDAGDGGEAQLVEAAARNGVTGRMHRLAAVWNEGRDAMVAAFDAFVLPSRTENFGNAAAEAAALGVPVIVSKECGVAEYIEKFDAGIVTEVDADDVAQALVQLRDDTALRSRLGHNGRALADELSPARIAALQETIYREVIG